MRTKIVAGNWKMNNDSSATSALLQELKKANQTSNARRIVAPAFTQLAQAVKLLEGTTIEVAAQNMNAATSGAFTGEVSASMLKGVGVATVIIGHSERRSLYNETDVALAEKVAAALSENMEVIFCFGEELSDRKSGRHFDVVSHQLKTALFEITPDSWKHIILAYEPVWAIGTGETASPEQAQEMHAHIRSLVHQQYGETVTTSLSILYGGSVKPNNAKEIFSQPDVDGGLIGGASLNANDFMAIVNAF